MAGWQERQKLKQEKYFLKNPTLKQRVQRIIGDLIYNDTLELIPSRNKIKKILLDRGFVERRGLKHDYVQYIEEDVRIHVVCNGRKGTCYYHIDNH